MSHGIHKCMECGTIISQCRCFDCSSSVVHTICLPCATKKVVRHENSKEAALERKIKQLTSQLDNSQKEIERYRSLFYTFYSYYRMLRDCVEEQQPNQDILSTIDSMEGLNRVLGK